MSAFRTAVTDLVITAIASSTDLEEAYACSQAVLDELPDAAEQDYLPALRRLADTMPLAPLPGAGVLALTAAVIVEAGGPAGVVLAPILEQFEEALEKAVTFVRLCEKAAGPSSSPREAIQQHGEEVARSHPREALAWNAVETLGLAMLTLLRDEKCRQRAAEEPGLQARLRMLREAHERAAAVLEMLSEDSGR